ncbi:hypothetical protein CK203_113580 [Vitis vinifera]|uniref:Uncharacterized protein n=1 Tax=Vitis vinifera TaxID=29760 RepID=A0A438D1D1_VITVI|nr:hypothetical protein CK203_113580 [Vitis vinifera]
MSGCRSMDTPMDPNQKLGNNKKRDALDASWYSKSRLGKGLFFHKNVQQNIKAYTDADWVGSIMIGAQRLNIGQWLKGFIDDAYNEGIPLLVLNTCCESEDKAQDQLKRQLMMKLGSLIDSLNGITLSFSGCLFPTRVAQHCLFIADNLAPERISKVKIVGNEEVEQSSYGQIILGIGKGLLSGVDEQLAKEAIKAVSAEKQRIAEELHPF